MIILSFQTSIFGWPLVVFILGVSLTCCIIFRKKKDRTVAADASQEKETAPIDPGDYEVDEFEKNVFIGKRHRGLRIRIMPVYAGKKRNPDQLIFSVSWPHSFNAAKAHAMYVLNPGLADVDFSDRHGLTITKSPAAKFGDLEDSILRTLFTHLHREHGLRLEKQFLTLVRDPDPNVMSLNFKVETDKLILLGKILVLLEGIVKPENGLPEGMDMPGRYVFSIQKAEAFGWEELLPKIKRTLMSFFPEGVEIIPVEIDFEEK